VKELAEQSEKEYQLEKKLNELSDRFKELKIDLIPFRESENLLLNN